MQQAILHEEMLIEWSSKMTKERRVTCQTNEPGPRTATPSALDYLSVIRQEAVATSSAASVGLMTPILRYPGWTVLDLITHTGGVHRWVTTLVRERSQERILRHSYAHEIRPDQVIDWFEIGAREMVATLESTDPKMAVWSLSDDRTVAFWRRRMAHETALHRWDAQLAHGAPEPIDPDLAVSALGESLDIYVSRRLDGEEISGTGEAVLLQCADRPGVWRIVLQPSDVRVERLANSDEAAAARITAGASDLWLFVMGRLPISALEVTGDQAALRLLLRSLSLMADALA
jgi:uncharacterized protein (TIGR03083 family)